MASRSTQPGAAENKSILTPVMTLEGHKPWKYRSSNDEDLEYEHVSYISYFPDSKQMISGSNDKTVRRWDLQEGKEIKEALEVCEDGIDAVEVSRDARWVVTASGSGKLKVSEVQTGIVRTFDEGNWISSIDISADSTLLAGGSSYYGTARIWNLDTGKLVAGPFKCGTADHRVGALRFSEDSRKLAVMSDYGRCLQVWDVQAQKLDVQRKYTHKPGVSTSPVLWTTKNKSIIAAFSFIADDEPKTIYEFDPSTLKTVGAPFKGHTYAIYGLALSSDCVLLASSSYRTIKLWAFESRQLLASFDVDSPITFVLSPDSRQLAYTSLNDCNIYICDLPADIRASIGLAKEPQPSTNKSKRSRHAGLLNSDATRRPVSRKPAITPVMSSIPRPLPTRHPHTFLSFLRKLLPSSNTDTIRPTGADELHNPLDFPATHALPRPLIQPEENSRPTPAPPTTQSSVLNAPATLRSSLHQMSTWRPFQPNHASPAIVDVPLAPAKLRYATAGAPGDDNSVIRDEDYVSPAPSLNSGQHGIGRFCFCF